MMRIYIYITILYIVTKHASDASGYLGLVDKAEWQMLKVVALTLEVNNCLPQL